jgi:hypothetical protein
VDAQGLGIQTATATPVCDNYRARLPRDAKEKPPKHQAACFDEKKSAEQLLCFSPACTLPQVLCQIQTYCSGVSVPAQMLTEVPGISRTTASATEQKELTPVVFIVTGLALRIEREISKFGELIHKY